MTKPFAYYNEFDKQAAAWLRELIRRGLIADGIVDERSIEDVVPTDLRGFTQVHLFAGIGGWSAALRRAGVRDDERAWTISCPCQPFSSAGQGGGFADERHLWPSALHLIAQCMPRRIYGEQSAAKAADAWVDLVQDDLEGLGYAFWAVAFPSAGVGAPHIRDRTYWGADTTHRRERRGMGDAGRARLEGFGRHVVGADAGRSTDLGPAGPAATASLADRLADTHRFYHRREEGAPDYRQPQADGPADWPGGCGGAPGQLADADGMRQQPLAGAGLQGDAEHDAEPLGSADGLGHADGIALDQGRGRGPGPGRGDGAEQAAWAGLGGDSLAGRPGATNGYWAAADWLGCRDGRWRAVEPGALALAHGAAARVGRLCGYGNAVNVEAARIFIEASEEAINKLKKETQCEST